MPSEIRACTTGDAAQICEIYNHYIRDTVVTFEELPVPVSEMAQRIEDVTDRYPWIVWAENGAVLGYAYASLWHKRSAYRHTVESTVYLSPAHLGRGIGAALYESLIEALRPLDVRCIIGGIALPNTASVALHEKLGYRKIGVFPAVGRKFERWIDVGYWQLMLDGPGEFARRIE